MGENSLEKVIILKITLYKLKIKLIVYTFGTPRGLAEDHVQPFQNVFNFVFGADVVTYVAPYFPVSGYTSEKESIEWLMVEDFFYAEFYAGKFLLHFDIFCKKSIELWRISFKIRL